MWAAGTVSPLPGGDGSETALTILDLVQQVVFELVPAVQVPLPVLLLAGLAMGWLVWEWWAWRRHR